MMVFAKFAIVAALVSSGFAANVETLTDVGNGVHVPGQIPANVFEPLQHRIAFAGPGAMTVSWSTFTKLDAPEVFYGTDPKNLNLVSTDCTSTTYPTSRTWNNHCKLQNLGSGVIYHYRVSFTNCAYCAYRPTYSFKTALAAGDMTPFTAAVVADLGLMGHDGLSTVVPAGTKVHALGANDTNTIQALLANSDTYEFLIHAGDIGYADYFLKESLAGLFGNASDIPTIAQVTTRYESLSEQFFDQLQPVTAAKPWMVSPGNHEANCDNGLAGYGDSYCVVGQTNFTFYIEHFRMPTQESHNTNNFWYSYDYGMTHFISLDTETDLGHGLSGPIEDVSGNHNGPFGGLDEQVDWLVADLAAVDRTKTPWVVVMLHRPWYTQVSPPVWPAWQEAFEQVFFDYEVDLYLQGHVHVFERMIPLFNGTIDPNGLNNPRAPWMILTGAAGHYDGMDTFTQVNPYTAYGNDKDYGWGRMIFNNATHLTYEYISSASGEILDSATLYKEHGTGGGGSSTTTTSSAGPTSTTSSSTSKMVTTTKTTTSSTATSTPTSCMRTTDCTQAVPNNAHRLCQRDIKTCVFRCNAKHVLSPDKKSCIPA